MKLKYCPLRMMVVIALECRVAKNVIEQISQDVRSKVISIRSNNTNKVDSISNILSDNEVYT